jgi:hypothetical protein
MNDIKFDIGATLRSRRKEVLEKKESIAVSQFEMKMRFLWKITVKLDLSDHSYLVF